jgi:pimeloyl-ACP methyl ester carboxylesterase
MLLGDGSSSLLVTLVYTSLILVHGALGSGRQLAPVADALGALLEATAATVELPGHGQTPATDAEFRMSTFAQQVAAVADACRAPDAPPAVVFGYSMGGYAALLAEAMQPGTFSGIVTYGTMFDWTPAVAAAATARLDPAVLQAKVPAFAEQLRERHAAAGGWEQMLSRTAALLRTLGDAPPLTSETLARIACPVQLLVGERDDTVTFAQTARIAGQLPRGTVTSIPDAPHPIEQVPVSALARALRDVTSSARR